ncbi:hypothetical protein ACFTZM_27740, partial [Streptomyces hydrogenans]
MTWTSSTSGPLLPTRGPSGPEDGRWRSWVGGGETGGAGGGGVAARVVGGGATAVTVTGAGADRVAFGAVRVGVGVGAGGGVGRVEGVRDGTPVVST